MKDQIIQFLNKENISATKLADDIGVQRSSISHILSGRNKPSYDFIEKMLTKYPQLNAEWLITAKGRMYKDQKTIENNSAKIESDLFTNINTKSTNDLVYNEKNIEKGLEKKEIKREDNEFTNVNNVEKIVFFYSNGKFKEYKPQDSII